MALSITDRILPQAGTFQFESKAPILNKSMSFAAGCLTESLRILVSLVEQVVVRTLYYTTFPTKWVAPSVHERLSNQLSASYQSLRNGIHHFAAIKKPASEPAPLDQSLTLLEKLRGHLPKVSTRMALTGVAIGIIGISLYYFGPTLASQLMNNAKEQIPSPKPIGDLGVCPIPENPFDAPFNSTPLAGSLNATSPIQEAFTSATESASSNTTTQTLINGAGHTADQVNLAPFQPLASDQTSNSNAFEPKVVLTKNIFDSALQKAKQLRPGQEYPFQGKDGSTACSGVIQNFGPVGILNTFCEEHVTKHTSYLQSQLLKLTPEGTTFEVGPLSRYQPAKLQQCLQDQCASVVQNCWNKARDIMGKFQCQTLKTRCVQQFSTPCLQKVSEVVADYPPFKCDAVNGEFVNCRAV